jgi:DNA-binding transcriptional MerR regulator
MVRQPIDPKAGVYGISVAAQLTGMDPQSLRLYERRGLLEPRRTEGGTRQYSNEDIDRLNRVGDMLEAGLNLAGIVEVFRLEAEVEDLRQQLRKARGSHRGEG